MQRFAVIGLGRFGSRLAFNLAAAGQEVIAIDNDVQLIQQIRDRVTLAVALDATDEKALLMQGIDQMDTVVVGIGGHFEAAVLITANLKKIGVPKIVSRAVTSTGARILAHIGANKIVNPEDESADRWTVRLTSPQFISHFEFDAGYSIVEVSTPIDWVGKTLIDLHLRTQRGLHVVAVKRVASSQSGHGPPGWQIPLPDQPLEQADRLLIMGADTNLAGLKLDP